MRELNKTEKEVMRALNKNPRPITILDMGIDRGTDLKYALMAMEEDGLIESRLWGATSPMRLYRALA